MKRAKQVLLITLLGGLLVPVLAFLAPEPQTATTAIPAGQFRVTLATSLFMTWFYIGSALLFLSGLGGFKDRLRHAYWQICLGISLLGVLLIQIPVLVAAGLFGTPWVTSGSYLVPYVGAWLLMYAGVSSFAKVLGDTSRWVRAPFVLACALAGLIATWLAAEYVVGADVSSLLLALNSADLVLTFVVTILILRIKQLAGPAYTNALAWFSLPVAITCISIILTVVTELINLENNVVAGLPFVLTAFLFVKAGYAFNKIKEY